MLTTLALFCDNILEAGWLAVLVLAPLYFNVYSSRVFEPDKITLVRSIALVMIGAWIVKQIETGLLGKSFRQVWHNQRRTDPLTLPTLFLVLVYLLATLFSLVPATSLWGSYQRLQGTFSIFSYITIFFIAAISLRTPEQFQRAINTALLVSFPIAFYGLLQHYQLDPLPWGGDVTSRVASNMGNSIFVAAYLIMIVPLTAARWIQVLTRLTCASTRVVFGVGLVLLALASTLLAFDFVVGLAFALSLFYLAYILALVSHSPPRDLILAATYTLLFAVQLVAIFFTQSRGPWLGLAAGLFTFVLLYAVVRGARRATYAIVALTVVGGCFLAVFNLPSSPLDPLKRVPYIGRLGQILETEGGTGKVRELIWQGALQLILPHSPIWSPTTGNDALSSLRPLVGYGPEAMYVAYNPFYVPALGDLEVRTASPDRSHNETLDSLVTMGLLGFLAYILLFISIFYLGLKSLGIIRTRRHGRAFVALWLIGGLGTMIGFGVWRGWSYLGVALPAGMIAGFLIFVILRALSTRGRAGVEPANTLWLCALMGALIGHFIEIHFGIAIVSTRTYFWFYAALLVVIGLGLAPTVNAHSPERATNERPSVIAWSGIVLLILLNLAYEFVTNQTGASDVWQVIQISFARVGNANSIGVLWMFALTWLIALLMGFGETFRGALENRRTIAGRLARFALLTLIPLALYVFFQARSLARLTDLIQSFLDLYTRHYWIVFILIGAMALGLYRAPFSEDRLPFRLGLSLISIPALLIGIGVLVYAENYAPVAADIYYKAGTNYDSVSGWSLSIAYYQRALELAPDQDYYMLFLGRAYLEAARAQTNVNARGQLLKQSEQTLIGAQRLDPLNTDHTANLARLYHIWSSLADDPVTKSQYQNKSIENYTVATRLSPNTAYLYNEWSQVAEEVQPNNEVRRILEESLQVDNEYAQTWVYLGDYYRATNNPNQAGQAYWQALVLDVGALDDSEGVPLADALTTLAQSAYRDSAIQTLNKDIDGADQPESTITPRLVLGDIYRRIGQPTLARDEFERVTTIQPGNIAARLELVNLLSEIGEIDGAVDSLRYLLDLLPSSNSERARFQDFYSQLLIIQRAQQAVRNAPQDLNAHRSLAAIWKARGQPKLAIPEYQAILTLAPNDYEAHKNLVLLNLQIGNVDDAARFISVASSLAPTSDRAIWQNLQEALTDQRANQTDRAARAAQAAFALASDVDKPALKAFIEWLSAQKGK